MMGDTARGRMKKKWWLIFVLLVAVLSLAFFLYAADYYRADQIALDTLKQDGVIQTDYGWFFDGPGEDRVLNMDKVAEADRYGDAEEIVLTGGNHAQFGNYGAQKGDGDAGLSSQEQQNETVECVTDWIAAMDYPYTPEGVKRDILEPVISFHPGTAGSSLQRAQAVAEILTNITDKHFRFAGEALEADVSLLTDEEQEWLEENLPGLIDEIDAVFDKGLDGAYEDAGVYEKVNKALRVEGAAEDWAVVKAALMRVIQ